MFGKAQKVQTNLKSNMDRFIAHKNDKNSVDICNLKSNMDRFIVPLLLFPIMTL